MGKIGETSGCIYIVNTGVEDFMRGIHYMIKAHVGLLWEVCAEGLCRFLSWVVS